MSICFKGLRQKNEFRATVPHTVGALAENSARAEFSAKACLLAVASLLGRCGSLEERE
jgi:hypothetical protein